MNAETWLQGGLALVGSVGGVVAARSARRTKRQERRDDFTVVTRQMAGTITRLEKRIQAREADADRMEEENGRIHQRMTRMESLLRAFSWTTDRWCQQMQEAGIEPVPAHPLVDEYNRTGA